MPGHDIIVIGGSAGSLEVIRRIVGDLPGDLPAAVFVVMHIPAGAPSMLPAILSSSGSLTAVSPVDGEFPHAGRIFVAPTDRHMLLEDDVVRVVFGPRHNRHRPAIDPLFDSAAQVHAGRVIAVILSGMLDDGAAGLANVHARGGLALVQDPQTAAFTSMPSRALDLVPSAERLRPARLRRGRGGPRRARGATPRG